MKKIGIERATYEKLEELAKMIKQYADDENEKRAYLKFSNQNHFPTIEDLKAHDVQHNIKKYLPYLIFYKETDIYGSNSREFQMTRAYITKLIEENVKIL